MSDIRGVVEVAERMPDGRVLLTVPEAAEVWRRIGNITVTPGIYRRRCKTGEMHRAGVDVSKGPRFLTDLDSLLSYFDRELADMRLRLDEALAERRQEVEREES